MALQKYYDIAVNYDGKEFIKINLDWEYDRGKVHLSMEPYLWKALEQFDTSPHQKQVASYLHTPPKYRANTQCAEYDTSPEAGKEVQSILNRSQENSFGWHVLLMACFSLPSVPLQPNNPN